MDKAKNKEEEEDLLSGKRGNSCFIIVPTVNESVFLGKQIICSPVTISAEDTDLQADVSSVGWVKTQRSWGSYTALTPT